VAATAGCIAPPSDPAPERGDVAIASYSPPDGTPAFCQLLADSVDVDDLPVALGTLTADPRNRDAVAQVADALAELEDVLAAVPDEEPYAEPAAGLEDLVQAVESATENPVDDVVRTRISTRLDRFGAQVQSVCDFPA
jgi:hypothetical protein